MSRPSKMTTDFLALCEDEAKRRASGITNKDLARRGGYSPKYISQLIVKLMRKYGSVHVSRES